MAGETYAQMEHHILMNRLVSTEAKQQIASKTKRKSLLWHPRQKRGLEKGRGMQKILQRHCFLSERNLESSLVSG